jgi:carbonic anhydrase
MTVESTRITEPKDALDRLLEGNSRFREGHRVYKEMISAQSRGEIIGGQHPYAAVLSCADSRVPTSHIFAAGLGEIFVCRNAGNIADEGTLGSLEYAVEHLDTPLVVVLAHTGCGAVGAAVDAVQSGQCEDTPCIEGIIGRLALSVTATRREGLGRAEWIDEAARHNAEDQCRHIVVSSSLLREKIESGEVDVLPLWYDLESGAVSQL